MYEYHFFETEDEAREFAKDYERRWYGHSGMAIVDAPENGFNPTPTWRVRTTRGRTAD